MRRQIANAFVSYNSNYFIFQKKDSKHNNIILNYNNSSYNNYLITKLEFDKFNFFRSNNCLQNAKKKIVNLITTKKIV